VLPAQAVGAAESAAGRERAGENPAAQAFAAGKVAAGLRPILVDGAKLGSLIKGGTGSVAPLVHAAHAVVLHHECIRDQIARPEFDGEMTATPAARAGR
jgi:hypothetical protein